MRAKVLKAEDDFMVQRRPHPAAAEIRVLYPDRDVVQKGAKRDVSGKKNGNTAAVCPAAGGLRRKNKGECIHPDRQG